MRNAPVMLGPTPKEAAMAGTRINEAKARPVPMARDPDFLRGTGAAMGLVFMIDLVGWVRRDWVNMLFTIQSLRQCRKLMNIRLFSKNRRQTRRGNMSYDVVGV
jgi:hypothetical protein